MAAIDHFVYRAGTAARPPSLSLLPARPFPWLYDSAELEQNPGLRVLQSFDTGVLCLAGGEDAGAGEPLVAQLQVGSQYRGRPNTGYLCVLRLGRPDPHWELLPIVCNDGGGGDGEPLYWNWGDKAFAVGDRFLCFVDCSGLLLWDAAAGAARSSGTCPYRTRRATTTRTSTPTSSPACPPVLLRPARAVLVRARAVGVQGDDVDAGAEDDDGGGAGHGVGGGRRARLRGAVGDAGVRGVEAEGLPRAHLEHPVVASSGENPDAVCFVVTNHGECAESEDRRAWMIEVDTRRKALLSVVPCTTDPRNERFRIPAEF
ncbi:hypothetical protein ACP4OV_015114 [Aristida adscensionis]